MRKLMLLAVAGLSAGASAAMADMVTETARFSGVSYLVNAGTGQQSVRGLGQDRGVGPTVIQNSLPGNPTPAVNVAFSQATSAQPVFGDDYTPIAGGNLDEIAVSLFNSSSTASGAPTPITAGSVAVSFWDAATFTGAGSSTPLGTFSAAFDFSAAPLAPGFFTVVGINNLGPLGIVLPGSGPVLMTYKWTLTGSTRHGFVSIAAPTVGTTGGNDFYMAGSAAENFYTLSGSPQPAVNVSMGWVVPAPAAASLLALGGLVAARRRRN